MALIESGPLSRHLDDEEIEAVEQALSESDIDVALDDDADVRVIERDVDEHIFADFLDRLDAQGAACDFYIPGDFEELIETGGYVIGSTHALMMALDELRDDIVGDEEDEDAIVEADDDDDEAPVGGDDEDFVNFDDDDDDDDRYGNGGEESVHIQASELRHLWKMLYKGARACVRTNSCLFIQR